MSKQYDNELKGALFKVEEDKKRENGPDYSGSATIEGTEYFMDAWVNTSDSGRKYMSFRFKAKNAKPAAKPAATTQQRKPPRPDYDDSDVPF